MSRNFMMTRLAVSLPIAALLCGCEAKQAPDSGFLQNPELMKHDDRLPVNRLWKDPDVKILDYDKLIVRPVRSDMQIDRTKREKRNYRNILGLEDSDVAEFAVYVQESFKKAVRKGPCRLKLVEEPGAGTLALEMSFVKIVQSKPVANAGKTALSATPVGACLVPVKFLAKGMTDSAAQSSLAIEGRLVDSVSGHTVAMFAQRSKQCTAVLNVEDFTSYGNLKDIVDAWSERFVEIVNKRPLETGEKIEGGQQVKLINF